MRTKIYENHGVCMRYFDSDIPSCTGEVVLFLHGWGLTANTYMSSLRKLAQYYRVVVPDLPGFGNSGDTTGIYKYDDFADVVIALVRSLRIDQFHLVGHSMGGGIGITVASNYSSMIKSLILVDSSGIPLGPVWKLAIGRIIELTIQLLARYENDLKAAIIHSFTMNSLRHFRNMAVSWNMPRTYDLQPLMDNITVPCSILWGEKDRLTPAVHGQKMNQKIAQSELTLVRDGYHEWCILQPEIFTEQLLLIMGKLCVDERTAH